MEDSHCFSHGFQTELVENFRSLREQSEGFDVMLGCSSPTTSNMVCLQAHKMLIAASSPLFCNVLMTSERLDHPTSPFLYLGEVDQKDLNYILDYIYNGKVEVPSEDINSFTSTAQQLQIKGIAKFQSSDGDLGTSFSPYLNNAVDSAGLGSLVNNVSYNGMIKNEMPLYPNYNTTPLNAINPKAPKRPKLEKLPKTPKEPKKQLNSTTPKIIKGTSGTPQVDDKFKEQALEQYKVWKEKFSTTDGNKYDCNACPEGKSFTAGSSLMRHYKQSHEQVCKTCKMPFHDVSMMQIHHQEKHEFPCNICGKVFTAPSSVLRHKKKDHPLDG